jgi:hypothetical protein
MRLLPQRAGLAASTAGELVWRSPVIKEVRPAPVDGDITVLPGGD